MITGKSDRTIPLFGKSTDKKPINKYIGNGSVFYEFDTSQAYMFDEQNKKWLPISFGGGGTGGVSLTKVSLIMKGTKAPTPYLDFLQSNGTHLYCSLVGMVPDLEPIELAIGKDSSGKLVSVLDNIKQHAVDGTYLTKDGSTTTIGAALDDLFTRTPERYSAGKGLSLDTTNNEFSIDEELVVTKENISQYLKDKDLELDAKDIKVNGVEVATVDIITTKETIPTTLTDGQYVFVEIKQGEN